MRELQQQVEEEEAGAIKWGDKMVRGDEDIKYIKNFYTGQPSLPARERVGDGAGGREKEIGRCQQVPQKSSQR